jgi:serine/threonine protein kinase
MDLAQTDWEKEVLLRKKKQLFYTEIELINILKDLIKTFAQLQRMNISHRDIKPQNILVFNEKHGYKLADFGEAKELLSNGIVTNKQTLRGTELYMSPILFHALRSKQYLKYINHNTYKSDVYSFGYCILFAAALCYEVLYDVRELTNNYSTRVVIERYYKLADFGEAKELLAGNQPTEKQTLRGTELYMSPLLFYGLRSRKIKRYIKHNPYKSDVFSLGLCLLFAATLCFESLYDVRELKSNVSIKIIIEKYLKNRYSYKIINIISSMLDINETSRDDFIELKKRIDESFNK